MNFNENDVWREKTELLNLKLSKLARAEVLLKLEFDTKDQVLFHDLNHLLHFFSPPKYYPFVHITKTRLNPFPQGGGNRNFSLENFFH